MFLWGSLYYGLSVFVALFLWLLSCPLFAGDLEFWFAAVAVKVFMLMRGCAVFSCLFAGGFVAFLWTFGSTFVGV